MKHILCIFGFISFLFCGCTSTHPIVTMDRFSEVNVGITTKELKTILGEPDYIKKTDASSEIYEYLEKISVNGATYETHRYTFYIRDGKVDSKRVFSNTNFPVEQRSSYELQTSHNEEIL